jgi:DNA-binding LacI/PurR family transcriptional regulator
MGLDLSRFACDGVWEMGTLPVATKPPTRRVTQADIAEEAGVSVTTVSLILSDREEWVRQFHPDTVTRVRQTATRLGYHTNLFAAGLPNKSSPFVALVIRDFVRQDPSNWHLWAFEGELLACVVKRGGEVGLFPIVVTVDPFAEEEVLRPVENMMEGGVFGSIVRAPNATLEKFIRQQINRGQRIVTIFPDQPSRWAQNAITVDDVGAGRRAGELLAAQGRRNWAVVHYRNIKVRESHLRRREGFEEVARQVGAKVQTVRLPRLIEEVTPQDLARIRRIGADGFFGLDSVLAICTLQTCLAAGMKPNEDFNLIGMNCACWHSPPLPVITSLDVSWAEVGEVAIRELIRMSETGETRFESIEACPHVMVGGTCPTTPAGQGS